MGTPWGILFLENNRLFWVPHGEFFVFKITVSFGYVIFLCENGLKIANVEKCSIFQSAYVSQCCHIAFHVFYMSFSRVKLSFTSKNLPHTPQIFFKSQTPKVLARFRGQKVPDLQRIKKSKQKSRSQKNMF